MEEIVELISIDNPILVGSSADPKIKYSADYDYIEKVQYSSKNIDIFVDNIDKLGDLIEDIKIGEIPEWNLMKDYTYSQDKELDNLDLLHDNKIITEEEYKNAKKMLKEYLTPLEIIKTRKELRFGLLRWTPEEIKKRTKILRNKQIIKLETALKSFGITKLDVIALVDDKYTEFSNIIFWLPYAKDIPFDSIKTYIKLMSSFLKL